MKRLVPGVFSILAAGFLFSTGSAFAESGAIPRKPPEQSRKPKEIGSWVVVCPNDDRAACRLRHRVWLVAPAGSRPDVALEVQMHHGMAVPVLAIHGVTLPEAAGAVLALGIQASIRFAPNPPIRLACDFTGDGITCMPGRADAPAAAAQLRQAKSAFLLVHLAAPAAVPVPVPDQSRSLDLVRTADALSRLEPVGDNRWDSADVLDWLAGQFGFPGGRAEVFRWLLDKAAALEKP